MSYIFIPLSLVDGSIGGSSLRVSANEIIHINKKLTIWQTKHVTTN